MTDTFGIVVTAFSVTNKANRVKVFEETFLVANISSKIVPGILFRILTNTDIDFLGWELRWKTYITEEALLTTKHVELVGKKEFPAAALNPKYETYIVYVRSVSSEALSDSSLLDLHPSHRPQISGLIAEEAPTKISAKFSDFADIFSPNLASELSKHTGINDSTIELVDGYQQPPYGPIYSLKPIELKTLKAYIETNLANGFIRPFKSPANTPILFDRKSDSFLQLCINYRDFNNLTIKNWYS